MMCAYYYKTKSHSPKCGVCAPNFGIYFDIVSLSKKYSIFGKYWMSNRKWKRRLHCAHVISICAKLCCFSLGQLNKALPLFGIKHEFIFRAIDGRNPSVRLKENKTEKFVSIFIVFTLTAVA